MSRETQGRWTKVITDFPSVLVHVSLLPDKTILYWGRRQFPTKVPQDPRSLSEHATRAYTWSPPAWASPWNPTTKTFGPSNDGDVSGKTSAPALAGRSRDLNTKKLLDNPPNPPLGPLSVKGETVNFFCGAHCFLPDGNLLIIGGHLQDNWGIPQTSIYDYKKKEFTAWTEMNKGRWYPSALPLADGRVFAISGSYPDPTNNQGNSLNNIPQVWSSAEPAGWKEVAQPPPGVNIPLYPRIHHLPDGSGVIMTGTNNQSWGLYLIDAQGNDVPHTWKPGETPKPGVIGDWWSADTARQAGQSPEGCSVMYDIGKVLYVGGGGTPTSQAETLDLNVPAQRQWRQSVDLNMKNQRRQFNVTVLPDGTVLATGGSKIGGFNSLGTGRTVHEAELWDPRTGKWTTMVAEDFDRGYHSTALLLPDARVLSAGGGEYGNADNPQDGDQAKNQTNAQIFEPPYLFKGPRPVIKSTITDINYTKSFSITVESDDPVDRVNLVRLGSVTHCCNFNQLFLPLGIDKPPTKESPTMTVRGPASASDAPPGYYMLFVLTKPGVPSVASMVRVSKALADGAPAKTMSFRMMEAPLQQLKSVQVQPTLIDHNERIINEQDRHAVTLGLTPICPYGLGGCWALAANALEKMGTIDIVRPVPSQEDALAFIYLKDESTLPDIVAWEKEFREIVNGGYDFRGVEMTLSGTVSKDGQGKLTLATNILSKQQVALVPFQASSQLKYDTQAKAPRPITDEEVGAYKKLEAAVADKAAGVTVQVTGTLHQHGTSYALDVREFEVKA